jgi:GNAT superfamily N-acetyltransferase
MPRAGASAGQAKPVKLSFKPVSQATRSDFIAVFDGPGGPKYCWCMAWRQTNAEVKDSAGPSRRKQMLGRIDAGTPVGLVGYVDGEPVAWVSIAPHETYRELGGPAAEPEERIWSIVCMYARRALRGHGLAHQMIAAAVKHARQSGASVVEAYPVDPDSPSYRHMGFVPAYESAGFREISRAGTRRHVMRLTLRSGKPI